MYWTQCLSRLVPRFLSLVLVSTVLCLSGCSSEPVEIDSLKVANAKQPSNALTFIALDQGYFKAEGLELEFVTFPSGKRALQEGFLDDKQGFDLVIASDMPFSSALQNHPDLVTFAHVYSADNVNSIVAREDENIQDFKDLAGKVIGTQKNSAVHFFLHQVLTAYDLDNSGIQTLFMPAEVLPAALAEGKIDAFSMREPFVSQARQLLDGKIKVLKAYGLYHQYELLISTQSQLAKKHRAVEKFTRALLKAQNFNYQNPQKAIEIVAKYLEITPQSILKSWEPGALKVGLQQGLLVTLENQQRWLDPTNAVLLRQEESFLNYFYLPILKTVAPEVIAIVYDDSVEVPAGRGKPSKTTSSPSNLESATPTTAGRL